MADPPDRERVYGPVFRLLERWHELPPIRGTVDDLLEKNALVENYVSNMEVKIRHTRVDLKHKFIPVPLVYTRDTLDLDFRPGDERGGAGHGEPPRGRPVLYQLPPLSDLVRDAFPNSGTYLEDPNLLAGRRARQNQHPGVR